MTNNKVCENKANNFSFIKRFKNTSKISNTSDKKPS